MSPNTVGTIFLIAAVFFDIAANILMKKSAGFSHKAYGIAALLCVGIAFCRCASWN